MRIDFSAPIRDLDGNPIENDKKPFTLKAASINALLIVNPNEQQTGEEKVKAFSLAMRINDAKGPVELTVEEVAKLKDIIGKSYGPIVVGRAYTLLENA